MPQTVLFIFHVHSVTIITDRFLVIYLMLSSCGSCLMFDFGVAFPVERTYVFPSLLFLEWWDPRFSSTLWGKSWRLRDSICLDLTSLQNNVKLVGYSKGHGIYRKFTVLFNEKGGSMKSAHRFDCCWLVIIFDCMYMPTWKKVAFLLMANWTGSGGLSFNSWGKVC